MKTNKCDATGKPLETIAITQISSHIDDLINAVPFENTWMYKKISNMLYIPVCKEGAPEDWFFLPSVHIDLISDKYKNIEINGINKYFYYSTDEDIIKNYNGDNKFLCRIKISRLVASILYKIHGLYDKIIIIHTFHAFEICKTIEKKVLDKIILFPMLLTPSYLKSGENIPKIYVNYEKKTLRSVFKIITPSIFECNQIRTIYKIEPHRVVCIPRYVSSQFNFSSHIIEFNKPIKNNNEN